MTFALKLAAVADELARLGYRATREGFSLVTDAPRRQVRISLARHRIEFWRECSRVGFTSNRYVF